MDADFTLKNARKRLRHLKQAVQVGGTLDVDTITSYPHPNKPGVIRQDIPNPLQHISPEVGAIAAELRAVLDQMLYALVVKRLGKAPENRPQFPICKKPEDFRSRENVDLIGLFKCDIAFIQQLQPRDGHDLLLTLKSLADSHKHRENIYLRATGVSLRAQAVTIATTNADTHTEGYFLLPVSGVRIPKAMHVQAQFQGQITLADGMPIIDLLEVLQAEVTSLLDLFKAKFSLS
jgi:hypothetical protein